jgi:hypothetical protein
MTDRNLWREPTGQGNPQIYQWALRLMQLFQQGRHKDYAFVSVTLTAGTSTSVAYSGMSTDHRVFVTPTNAAARALPVHVSAKTAGTGFTLTHGSAAGTETFDALVVR